MGRLANTYFSPDRGADDVVIGFIDHCHTEMVVAVYSLTHDGISAAIIRAHDRGVKVRVLTDSLQASSRYADDELLDAAGVPLRRDTQTGSMHNKFIVGDSKGKGLAVLTGSFNFTKSAAQKNAENFIVLRLQYVAREYLAEFERLWALNK